MIAFYKKQMLGRLMNDAEYEVLERFAIMSEQPDVTEIDALKYIQEQYGREIAVKIWQKYCNH